MLLIRCPWCAPRDEGEFRYGGQAGIAYPDDPDASYEQRENVDGKQSRGIDPGDSQRHHGDRLRELLALVRRV